MIDHRPYPFVSRPTRAPAPDRPVQRTLEEAVREAREEREQTLLPAAPLESNGTRDPARHETAALLAPTGRHPAAPETIEQRFWAFHARWPVVYETLLQHAREAHAKGARRIGIRMLWERTRWTLEVETRDPSGFKLNDQFTSRYSRLLLERNASWRGDPERGVPPFFETRTLRSSSEVWSE
jgi:hypothetical protein